MYQNYIGNTKFPQEDFGYVILQKMLSNDPKISFLWIFSGLILFWVKSTRLDNIFYKYYARHADYVIKLNY